MADPLTIAVLSTAVTLFSGFQQASAMEKQGEQQQRLAVAQAEQTRTVAERNALITRDQAQFKSAQLEQQGIAEQASAQQAFLERRRQSRLLESRAKAVAGSSGGGVGDPTALNIISGLAGEGEFGAQSALFEGESAASLLNTQSALALYEGEQRAEMTEFGGAQQSSLQEYQGANAKYSAGVSARNTRTAAVGKAVGSASSMYGKYGGENMGSYKSTNYNYNPANSAPARKPI